jgi:hypothetical protein
VDFPQLEVIAGNCNFIFKRQSVGTITFSALREISGSVRIELVESSTATLHFPVLTAMTGQLEMFVKELSQLVTLDMGLLRSIGGLFFVECTNADVGTLGTCRCRYLPSPLATVNGARFGFYGRALFVGDPHG